MPPSTKNKNRLRYKQKPKVGFKDFMADGKTPRCQAWTAGQHSQCRRAASHGYQVCSTHGAGSKAKPGGYTKEHRYKAFLADGALAGKMDSFINDVNPLDILAEVAIIRSATAHLLEQASGDAVAMKTVVEWAEKIINSVEKMQRIKERQAFGPAELRAFLDAVATIMATYITDADKLDEAVDELSKLLGPLGTITLT